MYYFMSLCTYHIITNIFPILTRFFHTHTHTKWISKDTPDLSSDPGKDFNHPVVGLWKFGGFSRGIQSSQRGSNIPSKIEWKPYQRTPKEVTRAIRTQV